MKEIFIQSVYADMLSIPEMGIIPEDGKDNSQLTTFAGIFVALSILISILILRRIKDD
jgi:hypothetical protein